jgi:hypothetical protein
VKFPALPSAVSSLPRARAQAGFALVDTMIAATVLLIATLGNAAGVFNSHNLNRTTSETGVATETLQRFVERLRGDPDWTGLYARLRPLTAESVDDASLSRLSGDTRLLTYPATTYFSDFVSPSRLGTVTFLVQVPSTTVDTTSALRESTVAPRYGLPYDLNGDGVIDGAVRDADYRALPVVVHMRWKRAGQVAKELVVATWLKGEVGAR